MKNPLLFLLLILGSYTFAQESTVKSKSGKYYSSSIGDFGKQEFTTGYDLMKIDDFKIVSKGENGEVLGSAVVVELAIVVIRKDESKEMRYYSSEDGNYDFSTTLNNYELVDEDQIIITSIKAKGPQGLFKVPGKVFTVNNKGYDAWRTDVIKDQLNDNENKEAGESFYKNERARNKVFAKRKALERRKLAKLKKESLKRKLARIKRAELEKRKREALEKKKREEEKERGELVQKRIKILDTDSRQIYYFVGTVKKDSRAVFAKEGSDNERVSRLLRMANIPGMVGAWLVYDKDGKVVARFQIVLSDDGKTYFIK